jgi:hypothetical protein
MTKLEELKFAYKAAWIVAHDADSDTVAAYANADEGADAWDVAEAAAAHADDCWEAAKAAWATYQEELKKSKENSND